MSVLPATPLPGQPSIYGRLWDLAAQIRTGISAALSNVDVAYVAPGDPVAEFGADQLTVEFVTVRQGSPGQPSTAPIMGPTALVAEYDVQLRREMPSAGTDDHGKGLTVDQLNLIAALMMQDAKTILDLVVAESIDWSFLGAGTLVAIVGLDKYGPTGGVVGWTVKLEVGLS